MKNKYFNKVKIYTTIAAILGFLFPLFALFMDSVFKNISFNITNIGRLHSENPIHLIIDVAPFVLSILVFFISKKFFNILEASEEKLKVETEKSYQNSMFAEKLRNGEINAKYENFNENDDLAKSLINLMYELKKNREEEKNRKQEDNQRHWATEGIAKFGEILRKNNNNIDNLSYKIITNLVKYLSATQGGFFVLNDEDKENKFLELTANYAYERKKFANKKIVWGEGLIGACAIEKETISMSKIPNNYVNITSGLGKANPRYILITPLIVNDEVFGVVEIASFKILEKFEIRFVERVAESIASALASFKISHKTAVLLKASRKQGNKLLIQEKAMRKNVEILKNTQREAAKQSESFISFTNSVNHTLIRAEYNINGELIYANTKFVKKMGYKFSSEIYKKKIFHFIDRKDRIWFDEIWDRIANGGKHFDGDMKHLTKNKKEIWTMATYVCIRDTNSKVEKILFLGVDITKKKQISLDFEEQISALNRFTLKAEYSIDGKITYYNKRILDALSYEISEVKGKNYTFSMDKENIENFEKKWEEIKKGIPHEATIKFFTKNNEEKWFNGIFTAIKNMYNEISKIIFIGNDTTKQELMEIENKKQNKTLKEQEKKLKDAKENLDVKLELAKNKVKSQFIKINNVKLLYEKIMEGMLDAVISINIKNRVIFFNGAAEELFKKKKELVIGKNLNNLFQIYHEKDKDYIKEHFVIGKAKTGFRFEVFIVNNNNKKINVLLTLLEAKLKDDYILMAFIQKIEIEFF